MFESHLLPGRKKIYGREVVFNLTHSGAQVGTTKSLKHLGAIMQHLEDTNFLRVLDFGAGKLRNAEKMAQNPKLKVYFSEFEALQTHALAKEDLKDDRKIATRLKKPKPKDQVSDYLRSALDDGTLSLLDRFEPPKQVTGYLRNSLLSDLNTVLWEDDAFFDHGGFGSRRLSNDVLELAERKPAKESTWLLRLNRFLLENAYPQALECGVRNQIYPHEYTDQPLGFDAILLSYVLHTIPHPEFRVDVLRVCRRLLAAGGLLVVASPKYNTPIHRTLAKGDRYIGDPHGFDGWVRGVNKKYQTFYSEPSRDDLTGLVESVGFEHIDPPTIWDQPSARLFAFAKPK